MAKKSAAVTPTAPTESVKAKKPGTVVVRRVADGRPEWEIVVLAGNKVESFRSVRSYDRLPRAVAVAETIAGPLAVIVARG
jgi:hypothetical protein